MSMLTTNCFQNWRITLERQEIRSCPFSHMIVFTSLVNRGFCPLTHSQEYPRSSTFPRVLARSRIDFDRERKLVLPRGCARFHWQSIPTKRVLDPLKVSSSSKRKSFLLSMCIDATESTSNSSAPLVFSKWVLAPLSFLGSPTH